MPARRRGREGRGGASGHGNRECACGEAGERACWRPVGKPVKQGSRTVRKLYFSLAISHKFNFESCVIAVLSCPLHGLFNLDPGLHLIRYELS
jgi:hypothetical protein